MNYKGHQVFRNEKGFDVIEEGPVIIEGVDHYVVNGFVSCNPSLNHKAWGVTPMLGRCPECYKGLYFKPQLELFENERR
jgi:hypothetical protein